MDFFPLPLFPEGSLRESVVTTVWVGVFVISFFNLRFGWTYSGLVVPGYLVPLMLTNPTCAFITMAEGLLAYALVRLFSEHLSRFGWWCNFFGRDRFLALFLSSVLVRACMDGWCLPALASWLLHQWNLTLDYQGGFHSFGMIIIALIANQFWKTGIWRGLFPFAATVGITLLLIRFVLMTATNFNVGHMAYMYANTAASLLASPKSYIILIVTAFVASRMNLRYGWEYNGVLIPALLALQWYEPLKILSSLAEAGVVYIVSDLLLQTRLFRGVTMEGARKLLLFFNVAYAYRYLLGWMLPMLAPGVVVTDYYGFAYLLSSLIALKMHSKHIVLRLTRATLQTSFVAAVAANLLGLWLASLFGSFSLASRQAPVAMAPLPSATESMDKLVQREKLRLYRKRAAGSVSLPRPEELNRFQEALQLLAQHADTGAPKPLALARRYLGELHYSVELVEPRRLCLREQEPNRGWGFYVLDLDQPHGLLVGVPAPLEEWSVADAAVQLYHRLGASALAIAGGARFANKDGSSDVLANANTPWAAFYRVFGRRNVLQVRGDTLEALRRMPDLAAENALYVKTELPRSLSLKALQDQIGDFRVFWKPAPGPNVQQRRTRAGFAEIWLTRSSRIRLKSELAESLLDGREPAVPENNLMLEWLLDQKCLIAKAGSNAYRPAAPEEMLYFDEEILTPLLEAVDTIDGGSEVTSERRRLLRAINCAGWLVGYEVTSRHDPSLDKDFLVLAESAQAMPKRFWGTLVLSLGASRPYAIQVPRPLFDLNTLEYGAHLFARLEAESLFLTGCHHEANRDHSADVLDPRNPVTLFSLVNQVIMREAHDRPKMTVQCRGYAGAPGQEAVPEVLAAFQNGIHDETTLTPLGRELVSALTGDGLCLQFVDGSPLAAGYEISSVPQAQYVNQATHQEYGVLWLSPVLREAFRPQDEDYPQQVQLAALGIPIVRDELKSRLDTCLASGRKTRLPAGLKCALEQYVATMDIVTLQRALKQWPEYGFSAVLDRNTRQVYLLVTAEQSALPVVLNLRPRLAPPPPSEGNEAERIRLFLASRSPWLEWPL